MENGESPGEAARPRPGDRRAPDIFHHRPTSPRPLPNAGSGSVGELTLSSGGAITPGSGNGVIGTLAAGSFVWNGGGVLRFDLGDAGVNDTPNLGSGALIKGAAGAYVFDFNGTGVENGTYTLITAGSVAGFTARNFSATNLAAGLSGLIAVVGNDIVLTVIPEPREYALGLAGAALVAARLRRRRRV